MPEDCKPEAAPPLTNAERQANDRARRQALQATPVIRHRQPTDRRSRPQRWYDAVAELLALQAEYSNWSDTLTESLSETPTAEALLVIVELDLSDLAAIQPSRGYGRD